MALSSEVDSFGWSHLQITFVDPQAFMGRPRFGEKSVRRIFAGSLKESAVGADAGRSHATPQNGIPAVDASQAVKAL
jgi:hypothetical protein